MPDDDTKLPEERSLAEILRAFEDEHLGPDVPRHNGVVEKGSGSLFAGNTDEWNERHRAHHAAIEALIAAETEHQQADAAVDAAHVNLELAVARVQATEDALDPAPEQMPVAVEQPEPADVPPPAPLNPALSAPEPK